MKAMSLLNPKRKKTKTATSDRWLFRMLFILPGLALVYLGWTAVAHGYWWFRNYNPIVGGIAIGPTLSLVFMGALLIFIGLIPWPRPQNKSKSRDDIYHID
jgi:hypothetical protein